MKTIKLILCLICLFCLQQAFSQIKPIVRKTVKPPINKSKFYLFLLVGQSNMAGRGKVESVDTLPNPKVLTLNSRGEWEVAKDPIHFDRSYAGVGPGLTFGKLMAEADTSIYIGLIPCAVGGSSINAWLPAVDTAKTGKNYKVAILRTRTAIQSGTLKGVIWHQGETDCTAKGVVNYQEKLNKVVNGFRTDLKNPTLTFIAGELPAFQTQQPDKEKKMQFNPYVAQINTTLQNLKSILANFDYVVATDTDHIGDYLHFNATSARIMGQRYANLMLKSIKQQGAIK
ncbi:sialate O-acetylesterase [Pedobacter cryophilus]|uniref:Sialate O-acetylesterase n=1 Tax=Pedobacter cryophilus TaxID=2571271 RepID=A0A4U1BTJ6_9SPHI|nr:sialate O-acetylesterase [Pedobacter cryophilus]TKB95231.1 sialate O-acetylesterase [Pedobacter cryophilus]